MSHHSDGELTAKLADATAKVEIGALYYHYKNPTKRYRVVRLVVLEADESVAVLYQIENGSNPEFAWVRPVSSFLDQVEWEGETVPRFTRVN